MNHLNISACGMESKPHSENLDVGKPWSSEAKNRVTVVFKASVLRAYWRMVLASASNLLGSVVRTLTGGEVFQNMSCLVASCLGHLRSQRSIIRSSSLQRGHSESAVEPSWTALWLGPLHLMGGVWLASCWSRWIISCYVNAVWLFRSHYERGRSSGLNKYVSPR